jgi:hypothetical protein
MYRPISLNRFKLFTAAVLLASATACASPTGAEITDCRDEFEAHDGRPLCPDVQTIQ